MNLCPDCGKSFVSLKKLERHQLQHIEDNADCEECGKSFLNTMKKEDHRRKVHGVKAICEECGFEGMYLL